ncbi:transcriptional regulator [Nonomuraea longispora]|uniref:Transcriptional regulator n=1 Tax=Nonomuraea longispora TaxID=1848320 RepID=A0A4R4NEN4_9ACTN|nr:transcriptional regulator [Nonomuraea longispora]
MIIVALLQRPARFSELARAVPGITDGLLTDRLRELMAVRLVERSLAGGAGDAGRGGQRTGRGRATPSSMPTLLPFS